MSINPCLQNADKSEMNHPKVRNNPSPRFWIKDNVPEINGKGGVTNYTIETTTLNTQSLWSLPGSSRVCEIQKGTR